MAFVVMAYFFLGSFLSPRGDVNGSFVSCFSGPFLCDHHGLHVKDYRTPGVRPGKGAGKNASPWPTFFSGQTGNPSNNSACSTESLYHDAWLAYAAGSGFDDFFHNNGRNFSRLG